MLELQQSLFNWQRLFNEWLRSSRIDRMIFLDSIGRYTVCSWPSQAMNQQWRHHYHYHWLIRQWGGLLLLLCCCEQLQLVHAECPADIDESGFLRVDRSHSQVNSSGMISARAFHNCWLLRRVVIANDILGIGEAAFKGNFQVCLSIDNRFGL